MWSAIAGAVSDCNNVQLRVSLQTALCRMVELEGEQQDLESRVMACCLNTKCKFDLDVNALVNRIVNIRLEHTC